MNGETVTIQQAVALHQAGQWDRAEAAYRRILDTDPANADALHLSGVIALQRGEFADAVTAIEQAVALRPQQSAFHGNLGTALQGLKRYDAAERHFRTALEQDARNVDARFNLGALHQEKGALDAAVADFAAVIRMQPRMAKAYHRLGMIFRHQGHLKEALRCLTQAVECDPDFHDAQLLLAMTHRATGDMAAALRGLRQLCATAPDDVAAHYEFAGTLLAAGQLEEAVEQYGEVLRMSPQHARAQHQLGLAQMQRRQLVEAERAFRQALQLKPDLAATHNSLGSLLHEQGLLSAAVECFQEAIRLAPQAPEPRANLAGVLQMQGRPAEAIAAYRRALQIDGGAARIHSNLLMALHYDPDAAPEEIFAEHQQWARRHLSPATPSWSPENVTDPQQRLRIGYLSADFRAHSVAFFIEPLLREHDRSAVEVTCYSDVAAPDEITARLQTSANHWRRVYGMSDGDLLQMIREDRIDVLVDLAGHTGGNRLKVLAQRAARVQMTHLGYGGTTGVPAVDYRLTDTIADPPGESRRHTEELAYLPTGVFCYAPPLSPPVSEPPCLKNGYVTFGSFNNLSKINVRVIDLWVELLQAAPGSRLLLKNCSFADAATRDEFRRRFAERGIGRDRLELLGHVPQLWEHLELYAAVDITLDTFPYTGATTTCESLWMGVPVVTLRGRQYVGRLSASILTHAGCQELIAESPEEYLAIAGELAAQPQRLEAVRQQLRDAIAESPVCDAEAAARATEELYRTLWQKSCRGKRLAG